MLQCSQIETCSETKRYTYIIPMYIVHVVRIYHDLAKRPLHKGLSESSAGIGRYKVTKLLRSCSSFNRISPCPLASTHSPRYFLCATFSLFLLPSHTSSRNRLQTLLTELYSWEVYRKHRARVDGVVPIFLPAPLTSIFSKAFLG